MSCLKRRKQKYSEKDYDLIRRAYEFAALAHREQRRASGEPYIVHPTNVALILINSRHGCGNHRSRLAA